MQKFLGKRTFHVVWVKKDKKYHVNSHVGTWKIVFFTRDTKMLIFPENLCADIKYPDVYFKMCF
jgi:hypothetical protein